MSCTLPFPTTDTRRSAFRPLAESLERTYLICRWELRSHFVRPATYGLLVALTLIAAWSFSWLIAVLARGVWPLAQGGAPIPQFLGANLFLVGTGTLLIPLLTMGLIADERRRGSWESLVTAPVNAGEVVCGKFAAAWMLWLACLSPWVIYLATLRGWNGKTRWVWDVLPWFDGAGFAFDLGPACGGLVGLAVIGGTLLAGGLFCSGTSRSPWGAIFGSFAGMVAMLFLSLLPQALLHWGFSEDVVSWIRLLAVWEHLERFSEGRLEPRLIVGHLSCMVCCLLLTTRFVHVADDAGQRMTRLLRPTPAMIGVISVLGLVNTATAVCLPAQYDLTRQQAFTLSPETCETLSRIKQPVQITLLASREQRRQGDRSFANAAVMLRELLASFRRQQPAIAWQELDPATDAAARELQQRYPEVTPPCVVIELGAGADARHEILQYGDLMEVHAGSPSVAFLGEPAITAALGRMAGGKRQILAYVLTGHGELDLADAGPDSPRGLGVLAERLQRLDCELRPLDLLAAGRVPADADVVLLAGPETVYSADEIGALKAWLRLGGRLCLLFDRVGGHAAAELEPTGWEPLLQEQGVALGNDFVVTQGFTGKLEIASPALPATDDHPLVKSLPAAPLTLLECRTIRTPFDLKHRTTQLVPLLVSHPFPRAWAEGDAEGTPKPGSSRDTEGPVVMAAAVERQATAGMQPVLVLAGDAEFVSNRFLQRPEGRQSLQFISASFRWLCGRKAQNSDIPPQVRALQRLDGTPEQLRGLVWKPCLLLCAVFITLGSMFASRGAFRD